MVVGNAMEGEPLSYKDAVLLTRVPHLVVDGLAIVARTIGAHEALLAIGPEISPVAATEAARSRGVQVARLEGGFVAGQESALVNQLDGRPAIPSDPLVRVTTKGVDGRPTLVLNAETLAQLGLIARHGAAWFREAGTPEDPGTSLFSVERGGGAPRRRRGAARQPPRRRAGLGPPGPPGRGARGRLPRRLAPGFGPGHAAHRP